MSRKQMKIEDLDNEPAPKNPENWGVGIVIWLLLR